MSDGSEERPQTKKPEDVRIV